jgi:hypothetical protein
MIASWAILCNIHGKPHQYPNNLTLEVLSQHDKTQEIFVSITNEDGGTAMVPSYLEASCKTRLRHSLLSRDINFTANNAKDTVKYECSMPIAGCIPKHRRRHPANKGNGYMGAVLSDTKTFVSFIKYILCYHAWCHYSHQLPPELQENYELINYASMMVVQYFDTIVYHGDDTVDSDTCKIHTQLHNARIHKFLGDTMQYNTAMGECGLKVWAKRVSKTAPKQGRDKFTFTASARVGERMLLNAMADLLASQQQQEDGNKIPLASSSKRKVPHFRCQRVGTSNILRLIDQKGKEQLPLMFMLPIIGCKIMVELAVHISRNLGYSVIIGEVPSLIGSSLLFKNSQPRRVSYMTKQK